MENNIKYGIIAYRSNGERVYFCDSSNWERMVPYAASIASKYDSKKEAGKKMEKLKLNFVGLSGWSVFQDI